ncbi:MAG: NAD-dependent epimerase/dehydratase family protein [Luteitalea sp.]|nr:NAD-dependent epimerase/dehydratase family protein [Luteitalea sp.]
MRAFVRAIHRPLSVLLHLSAIVFANYAAFWLRFDGAIPEAHYTNWIRFLPYLIAIRAFVFVPMRMFEGLWRYTSLWDLRNIILAVGSSSVLFYLLLHQVMEVTAYPRSVFVLDMLLLICMMTGMRLSRRIYRELQHTPKEHRVLIYGAGDAGELLVRDMRHDPAYPCEPVAFADDDPGKRGESIHGIPVLGGRDDLDEIIAAARPHEVVIAIPRADPRTIRTIVRALEPFKLPIKTLPRMRDIVDGRVQVSHIRSLVVEDLLSRAAVDLDTQRVQHLLHAKRVLVTGAGGSIGSELCRQIVAARPAQLVLLDRYENSLHAIHGELIGSGPSLQLTPAIADITDAHRLAHVFAEHRPQIVFHAAAHKHVPLMEDNPCEAVKNNVRGTRLVVESAVRWGVDRFVLISTDKAVNPSSVMGATKRVAELIVQSAQAGTTKRFVTVRFGNVLASNGSVVPHFLAQIKAGGPVTVTHPDMRRYFMLIPEAVQLVLHAAALEAGSIYVLDMGDQIRVADMARDLIRLAGFVPDEDIQIVFTGVRPGEKLEEELLGPDEVAEACEVDSIHRVRCGAGVASARLNGEVTLLERFALEDDTPGVLETLRLVVPSFTPRTDIAERAGGGVIA